MKNKIKGWSLKQESDILSKVLNPVWYLYLNPVSENSRFVWEWLTVWGHMGIQAGRNR